MTDTVQKTDRERVRAIVRTAFARLDEIEASHDGSDGFLKILNRKQEYTGIDKPMTDTTRKTAEAILAANKGGNPSTNFFCCDGECFSHEELVALARAYLDITGNQALTEATERRLQNQTATGIAKDRERISREVYP